MKLQSYKKTSGTNHILAVASTVDIFGQFSASVHIKLGTAQATQREWNIYNVAKENTTI